MAKNELPVGSPTVKWLMRAMMDYTSIEYSIEERVAFIHLNRPDSLNAYTPDMGEELVHAFRRAAVDDSIQVVVLTGRGRAFCAGADRAFLQGERGEYGKRLGEEEFVRDFSMELANHPKLTIAAINGSAAGIGVTASLALDLRVVRSGSRLVLNFAELGLIPGMGATYFLPRLIGLSKAKDLLICQRKIDADRACDIGLVDYVTDDVVGKAVELAQAATQCKPGTLTAIKTALLNNGACGLETAVEREWSLARALRGDFL
ncbi:enoyl-CoA hydratase/isomerase family protein [Pseudomaricurvus alkylphenolicus]|uniref:enoyl-CoA hydratase/isomerase family protein n=1 Tax=Pseudomaricurvus alkylphenolicus TaxID=1306991 RepID=UPI001F0D2DB5|nr:enoyl-CoA hydratase/isomerase family protein [Pseudomaricurvus alkylphenolicus]